jgi:rhodanese-related sulfurtransferase
MAVIDATEFTGRTRNGEQLNLLDVREELEYLTYNIGGKNIPLSKLPAFLNDQSYNKTSELIVICTMGLRSETACRLLAENGYTNARNLAGGLIALKKQN